MLAVADFKKRLNLTILHEILQIVIKCQISYMENIKYNINTYKKYIQHFYIHLLHKL